MAKDDDILLGEPLQPATDTDSDGDGVGDMQERLEGTDPGDASDHLRRAPTLKPNALDPRGDLDRPSLEREVGFDANEFMPEGMSIESGLNGLKNLDGSDLPTGTNHYGVGEDDILDGRLDANSPLSMERDPFASTQGTTGSASPGAQTGFGSADSTVGTGGSGFTESSGVSGGHSGPPPGQGPSGSADPGNNPDLVGWTVGGVANVYGKAVRDTINVAKEVAAMPKAAYDGFVQGLTEPTETPAPPVPDAPPTPPPPAPEPWQDKPKTSVNPDADTDSGGGAPKVFVEPRVVPGYGGTPQIKGDAPTRYIDLVTDGGDGTGDIDSTGDAPRGRPDDPVIRTVNPVLGIDPPPTGDPPPSGGGGPGDDDFGFSSSAATAATNGGTGAPGISQVGSGGGGGISSVAPSATGASPVAGLRDPSIRPLPDAGASAVDKFATEYLEDAAGLAADLNADLVPRRDDLDSGRPDDLDSDSPDDFAANDHDPFDG